MNQDRLRHVGLRALLISFLLTLVFSLGSAVGVYVFSRNSVEAGPHGEADERGDIEAHLADVPEDEEHEEEEDHVALTEQAYANLNLKMGPVPRGDYWKTLLVPARVAEIPGQSDLSVPAPVTGVLEEVRVLPGQSIEPGEPLFVIRLTDEALIDAQSTLLELTSRKEVATKEIARLNPLKETGAVAGAKVRQLEYELNQLETQQSTLLQELRSRGLPQSIIQGLIEDRVLASTLTVFPPEFVAGDAERGGGRSTGFSVEHLRVHPGKSVVRGEPLCTVAYHSTLYLEGTAFGDDLPVLNRIAENGWKVTVEHHDEESHRPLCLDLLRVDNHVDEESQTVKFFIELPNEVTRARRSDGRLFEQWRFRPGQRLHLRLPVEKWSDQLTLPVDAVVVDGPNVFVFAEHQHEPVQPTPISTVSETGSGAGDPADASPDEEADVYLELEPVPVRMLYRDDKTVVIADDGQIPDEEPIALNNAYKLYLEMKMQAAGGGHHHHHDH